MRWFIQIFQLYTDSTLVAEYVQRNSRVWSKVLPSRHAAGVFDMILKTSDDLPYERRAEMEWNVPVIMHWKREMATHPAFDTATDGSSRRRRIELVFQTKEQTS